MNGGAQEQIRPLDEKLQHDDRTERHTDHMRWLEPAPFDHLRQILYVVLHATPWEEAFDRSVATAIVCRHPAAAREQPHDRFPVTMIARRTMHEDDRRAILATRLHEDLDSADGGHLAQSRSAASSNGSVRTPTLRSG